MQIDWVFVGFAFAAGLLSPFFLWVIKSLGYASRWAYNDTIWTARNLRGDAKNWRLIYRVPALFAANFAKSFFEYADGWRRKC